MVLRLMTTVVLCLSCWVQSGLAFRPSAMKAPARVSTTTIFSEDNSQQYFEEGSDDSDGTESNNPSGDQKIRRLTRQDPSTAQSPNRPLLGEVAVDGSLVVLAPAVVIGVVGFICTIVVAFNSGDEFVQTATQISDDTTRVQVSIQSDVYDPNACRGICTQDQEGLKNFMQSLRK